MRLYTFQDIIDKMFVFCLLIRKLKKLGIEVPEPEDQGAHFVSDEVI